MNEIDIDLIVCDDCLKKQCLEEFVIPNEEYVKLISTYFNECFPLEIKTLIIKCSCCNKLIKKIGKKQGNI